MGTSVDCNNNSSGGIPQQLYRNIHNPTAPLARRIPLSKKRHTININITQRLTFVYDVTVWMERVRIAHLLEGRNSGVRCLGRQLN